MKNKIFKIVVSTWNILPFKKLNRKFISFFPKIKYKLYKDLRYEGVMIVNFKECYFNLYNPGYTTIENEIFWNGLKDGWESVSLNIWSRLCVNSKGILDIGANTGVYSFIAASLNSKSPIYSFEPVQRTAQIFKKNLELNSFHNINLISKAVSSENSIAVFYDVKEKSQYSASLNENMLKNISNRYTYDVETVALDEYLEEHLEIDLIKLDVEMHEPEAVLGMIDLIRRNQPTMLIEVLNQDIANRLNELLGGLPYLIFSIDEKKGLKRINQIEVSDTYNVLLITQENSDLIEI